jgi:hypothetical protein
MCKSTPCKLQSFILTSADPGSDAAAVFGTRYSWTGLVKISAAPLAALHTPLARILNEA